MCGILHVKISMYGIWIFKFYVSWFDSISFLSIFADSLTTNEKCIVH